MSVNVAGINLAIIHTCVNYSLCYLCVCIYIYSSHGETITHKAEFTASMLHGSGMLLLVRLYIDHEWLSHTFIIMCT